jgi:amino-acid N-acetyltransferase
MRIRKAAIRDIRDIHSILKGYADLDLLLPRPLSELYDHLRDYFVLQDSLSDSALPQRDPENLSTNAMQIQGVCGLHICWEDLAEIQSLAVREESRGRGFGCRLVRACIDEAHSLGVKRVFVLTYIPDFFRKLGFKEADKALLPHKIWADCLKCPKFPDCGEVALIHDL